MSDEMEEAEEEPDVLYKRGAPAVNKLLADRLTKAFEEGFNEQRSGMGTPPPIPGVTFRLGENWFNTPEAQHAANRAYRDGHIGQEDQYDGYVYDMHGNRIGVEDPEEAWKASQPVVQTKVTVTIKKHEPLALPQYCDSTLAQQIMEARMERGGL